MIRRVLSAAILVIAMGGGLSGHAPALAASDACKPDERAKTARGLPLPPTFTTETDIVHVRIGGHDLFVPHNYFRYPPIGCGAEQSSMLLRVWLPNLEPYSERPKDDDFKRPTNEPTWMNILVGTIVPEVTMNKLAGFHIATPPPESHRDPELGLTVTPAIPNGNVYVDGHDRATTVIICDYFSRHPSFPREHYPRCMHFFDYRGLRIDANYSQLFLPQWKKTEASMKALLDRFMDRGNEGEAK